MGNPFYLQEVPVDAPFCDRVNELKELESYAEARANVVLFSPRRYGKTSLIKRIQKGQADRGAVTLFADFFGVASVEDVAARLARAVFVVTHGKDPLWKKALRTIRSFRPVLKPDLEGGVSLTVEPSSAGRSGLTLLEETMESLGEFIGATETLVHVAFDEFQEIVVLKEALQIEGAMRTRIQQHRASYFFIGSRRRVLLGIFNERQRPFFQSAINYPLNAFPPEDLERFIVEQFMREKRKCSEESARHLASLAGCHPYYSMKLAFLVFELSKAVTNDAIRQGFERLILSERPVFEAIFQGLSPHQRLVLRALAIEPTGRLLAGNYIRTHGLRSVGGVQHSLRQLEELDLMEKDEETGLWRLVDPIFSVWLKRQTEEKV
jgi:uncharacterized protein